MEPLSQASRTVEIERRFPVKESVFKQVAVERGLQLAAEYPKIVDTYYLFSLLKRVMVRARHADILGPQGLRSKYELSSKAMFTPSKVMEAVFSHAEAAVSVDSFEKLKSIFSYVKEEEFTISGTRKEYRLRDVTKLPFLVTITNDVINELQHKHWIEVEILLREGDVTDAKYLEALKTIKRVAKAGFGVDPDYLGDPTVYPLYPEIFFWEQFYEKDWCEHKPVFDNMVQNWPQLV